MPVWFSWTGAESCRSTMRRKLVLRVHESFLSMQFACLDKGVSDNVAFASGESGRSSSFLSLLHVKLLASRFN